MKIKASTFLFLLALSAKAWAQVSPEVAALWHDIQIQKLLIRSYHDDVLDQLDVNIEQAQEGIARQPPGVTQGTKPFTDFLRDAAVTKAKWENKVQDAENRIARDEERIKELSGNR